MSTLHERAALLHGLLVGIVEDDRVVHGVPQAVLTKLLTASYEAYHIAAALERQGEGENERHMRNLGSIADALYGDTSPQGER